MPLVSSPFLLGLTSVLAQLQGPTIDLPARAAASPRPPECSASERSKSAGRSTLWQRARDPALAPYCAALARGYASLSTDPAAAKEAVGEAEAALPGRAATRVLAARALLASGDAEGAWKQFEAAGSAPWLFRAPEALHDRAVAASRTRHFTEAIALYRALVPRAELWDRPAMRARVCVEAAAHVMLGGPTALDEAIGYLSEARRAGAEPSLLPIVLGALALALDRQGRTALARGVAAEAGAETYLTNLESDSPGGASARQVALAQLLPVLPPGEFAAIVAIVADVHSQSLGRDHWQSHLELAGESSPWRAHAQAKLGGSR
jgi:hypothetical protein